MSENYYGEVIIIIIIIKCSEPAGLTSSLA